MASGCEMNVYNDESKYTRGRDSCDTILCKARSQKTEKKCVKKIAETAIPTMKGNSETPTNNEKV